MKKLSFIFAMVFVASMVMAQDNESTVDQKGDANSAIISQIGLDNESTVGQEGNLNQATIHQFGLENMSLVNQKSFGTNGGVKVFAIADINQKGYKNINIVDVQDAFYGFSVVDVDQIGDKNEVRLQTQNGGGIATISMTGDHNILKGLGTELIANQKNNNEFKLQIEGHENIVGMSQEFGKADVDVFGSYNKIEIRQLANGSGFNETDIDVYGGCENTINVDQASIDGGTGGFGNYAEIELAFGSDWNNASVIQRGSFNESENTVTGDSNTINVYQQDKAI